jgi:hypothetical protein
VSWGTRGGGSVLPSRNLGPRDTVDAPSLLPFPAAASSKTAELHELEERLARERQELLAAQEAEAEQLAQVCRVVPLCLVLWFVANLPCVVLVFYD